jgi:hypothetical protein
MRRVKLYSISKYIQTMFLYIIIIIIIGNLIFFIFQETSIFLYFYETSNPPK